MESIVYPIIVRASQIVLGRHDDRRARLAAVGRRLFVVRRNRKSRQKRKAIARMNRKGVLESRTNNAGDTPGLTTNKDPKRQRHELNHSKPNRKLSTTYERWTI
jgi:hypothetical protein